MPNLLQTLPHEGDLERKCRFACARGILRSSGYRWKQTECFPLTKSWPTHHAVGEVCSHLKLLAGRLISKPLTWHGFRRPNFSIHYIPSGIPVSVHELMPLVFQVINFLIFNVSHLFTFNSCPLLLLKLREWPETAKVIHSSFVYSMPWAFVSNI